MTHATSNPTTKVSDPGIDLAWLADRIDYRRFQECVHCGLCTASCPTYIETGDENDGPRGRIYLMRAVTDGRLAMGPEVRRHLELCLDCRACETACPSGVQYGRLIEPFKVAIQQTSLDPDARPSLLQRLILKHLFPYPKRVRLALLPARIAQKLGLLKAAERVGLTKLLPPTLRGLQAMLPDRLRPKRKLPGLLPAIGTRRARVALFNGCVADAMFPETNAATARVLQKNGCEVVNPARQVCCGAIHYHSGMEAPAIDLARKNLDAFDLEEIDAIIVNAAGCGAMLKDYPHLMPEADRDRAVRFASKVRDVSEFLYPLGLVPPTREVRAKVAYHDACHLCHGQGIRSQPRQLLAAIPGVELVPLKESELCCGAAGTYNLTEPEMSARLGRRKVANIEATGAEVVATGNVGCILQIAKHARDAGLSIEVVHPIDLLDRAYGDN